MIYLIYVIAKINRDAIFELEEDIKITDEEYIEIFNREKYKLINKKPEKIEFNKFSRFMRLNNYGYIEFLGNKIRIRSLSSEAFSIEDDIMRLQQKNRELMNPSKIQFQITEFDEPNYLPIKFYLKYTPSLLFSLDGIVSFMIYLIIWNLITEFQVYNNFIFYIIITFIFIIGYPFYFITMVRNIKIPFMINNHDIKEDILELLIDDMGYHLKIKTEEYCEYQKPSRIQILPLRLKREDLYYLISVPGRTKDLNKIKKSLQSKFNQDFKTDSK